MSAYPLFPKRTVQSLDGSWSFKWLGAKADIKKINPEKLVYDEISAVPGVFDTALDRFGARGTGVYRRQVKIDAKPKDLLRLKLGGLGLYAKIWWDGKEIAECKLPYSTVNYDFLAGRPDVHELVIAVDNRFSKETAPLFRPFFDFYGYGGIYRGIELQRLPSTRIERAQINATDIETGIADIKIKLGGEIPEELSLSLQFDNGKAQEFKGKTSHGSIEMKLPVPNFKTWSLENPNLHIVELAIDGDSIIERFGIRRFETRGQQILLNGKPVILKGVNRHEAHPEFGPVQNTHLLLDDLRLLKDLGCNFVRCVHYPHSQEFLDLCDEAGILVWQESMGWNNSEEDALDKEFFALQVAQTKLMVENGMNHPSVLLWCFLNECCSNTKGGRKLYEALAGTIRAVDPSFLVSYASNKVEGDICFDLADVAAINIYPGWISNTSWETPASAPISGRVEEFAKFANNGALKDKPLIVSEIGACGLYGCHDRATAQWSEEFQADYMATACREILGNKRYAGVTLWQFFDARTFVNYGDVRCKPRGFNCAGLLDEYRRPKLAYDAVKAIYRRNA